MSPLLSVVVPCYKVAEDLPDCLDSILNNTLQDLEVIVVDDGSPDESGEIAEDYAARDPRVKVLHQDNGGLGPARNSGAAIATGKYLTFVDSDDLIPARAFEQMVTSLEETGSDFAAGNAWRYFAGRGNVPSWTHRQAFAEDRPRTHIREFPLLVRDRMAWNKVWRRTFWEKHSLEFPPIRYEDFPVTLKAHLLAESVDVLSSRVYMWRQRESGESITQRSADADNVADRVRSAEMVLDVADGSGSRQIRDATHAYFIDVDLVTVAEAYASCAPEDEARMRESLLRLARRLRPQRKGTTRLARVIHLAARRRNHDAVKAMATWRLDSDRGALFRAMLRPASLPLVPFLAAAVTPKRSKVLALRERRLRSTLEDCVVVDGSLHVRVALKLRRSILERATVGAELVVGRTIHQLDAELGDLEPFGGDLHITIPLQQASKWLSADDGYLRARISLGPLRWRGPVPCTVANLPNPQQLEDGTWLIASHRSSATTHLWLRLMPDAIVGEVELAPDGLNVGLPDMDGGHVAVVRTAPSRPLIRPVTNGRARFPWSDVARDDPADNPASGLSYRALVYLPTLDEESIEQASVSLEEQQFVALDAEEMQLASDQAQVDEQMAQVTDSEDELSDRVEPAPAEDVAQDTANDSAQPSAPEHDVDDEEEELVHSIFASRPSEPIRHGAHEYRLGRTRLGAAEIEMQLLDHIED